MSVELWLEWGRGPLFVAALVVLVAGLLRLVALNVVSLAVLYWRSRRNGRTVPWGTVFANTLKGLRPMPHGRQARGLYSLVSVLFHTCIIVTPLFLSTHLLLWERGLGVRWPALSNLVADWLTVVAIVSALVLLLMRLGSRQAMAISRPQDYLLMLLILAPVVSGFLAMHPELNPFSYSAAMMVHVLSGDLILVLIPFTKISHVALLPLSQLVSELGWHLEPHSGERVALELGKEGEAI